MRDLTHISVALSISDKICESKISTKDIAFKEERVNKMLYRIKIYLFQIQLSNVKMIFSNELL